MISPEEEPPSASTSQLCGFQSESVAESATATIMCDAPLPEGRYVIVQIQGSDEMLTLCEVQVYVESKL